MASSSVKVMEKPNQELLQQQQQALRCPRCDSSNTKFCYYNNYSLSQPRHFCKACKRYWTRGGTLRNVPVGGGCRKNKRVKRAITTSSSSTIDLVSSVSTTTNVSLSPSSSSTPSANSNHPSTTSNQINPLFYGLPGSGGNSSDVMNLQFPRFNSRVYDLQPHMNALGLGFSSGVLSNEVNDTIGYRNGGFSSSNSNNNNTSFVSSYNSIFGGSSTSMPSNPVMASLLSSTLLQQKFLNKGDPGSNGFRQGILMEEVNHGSEREMVALKDVKVEGQNRLEWNNNSNNNGGGACQNQMEHMGLLSDPSLYWNNTTATTGLGGAWSDQPNNIGPSSVTPLI